MNARKSFLALVACLLVGNAYAQKVEIKPRQNAGDSYTFEQTMNMQMNMSISANGQQQQITQNMSQTRAGKVQVIEAQNGEPTKASIAFDPNCGGFMEMVGQGRQDQPFGLAGKSAMLTRQTDGTYKVDAEAAEETLKEAETYVKIDPGMFPKNPVGPGDTWDVAPEEFAKAMQMDPTARGTAKGKLVSLENVGGRQIANVDFAINIAGQQPGAGQMTFQLNGTVKIDVASGRTVGGSLSGPMTVAGQPQPGVDLKGNGQMTMTFKGTVTGNATVPAPVNPNPNPQPNPFDPGAPVASLAGEYTGDKLSMDLKSSGPAYEGTITLKGNTYPFTATAQGNNLTGKFTAGGNSFDFTATITGDAMTFKTGSSTYDMKKKGAKNPLE